MLPPVEGAGWTGLMWCFLRRTTKSSHLPSSSSTSSSVTAVIGVGKACLCVSDEEMEVDEMEVRGEWMEGEEEAEDRDIILVTAGLEASSSAV
jgi:hypothetical protein